MADRKGFDLLIKRALMNNSFDYDSLDRTLDKTYKNAYSTLLHKHASVVGCPIYQFFSSDKSHYRDSYVKYDRYGSVIEVYTESGPGHFKKYEKDPDSGEYRFNDEVETTVEYLVENMGCKLSYDLWEWNNKQPGNLYVDERNKAAVTIPVNLFTTNVLKYRTSRYYNTWIPHYDLITRTDIFYKVPIIIIDDMVVTNYSIKFIADGFTVRLPYDRDFVHDATYRDREENGRFYDGDHPKFIDHDIRVVIINNYMNLSYITNLRAFDINPDNPYMTIPYTSGIETTVSEELDSVTQTIGSILGKQISTASAAITYLKDAMKKATNREKSLPDKAAAAYEAQTISYAYANDYAMYTDLLAIATLFSLRFNNLNNTGGIYNENNGIFFVAFTFNDTESTNLYPTTVVKSEDTGDALKIIFPTAVHERLKAIRTSSTDTVKITFYYLKDLKRYEFAGSNIIESKYGLPHFEECDRESLPLLWLKDGDISPKKKPVPIENFIIFNSKDGINYNIVNAHHTLKLHYPNLYEFIDKMAEDGVDKYQVFYYYQDFDTGRFRPLYQYFFDFIYLYINRGPGPITPTDTATDDTATSKPTKTPEETLTDIYHLMINSSISGMTTYMRKIGYVLWTDEDSATFKRWFDVVFNYDFFEFKYGPADYDRKYVWRENNTAHIPPMQYKDEIMRDLIDRDPYVLRDYVLDQYKVGEYHYIYTRNLEPSLEARRRLETSDISTNNPAYQVFSETDGRYVFTFLNEHPQNQNLEIRLFVDGILCDDLVSIRSGNVQYVYVPTTMFNTDTEEGSYIWIDVFPGFSWNNRAMFNFSSLDEEVSVTIPVISSTEAVYCHVVIGPDIVDPKTGQHRMNIIGIYDDEHIELIRQMTSSDNIPDMLHDIESGNISQEVFANVDNIGSLSDRFLYVDITTAKVYRYYDGHCALESITGFHNENLFPTLQDLRFMEKMESDEQIATSADTSLDVGDYICYSKNFFRITGEYKFYTPKAYYYESKIIDKDIIYPVRFPRVVHLRIKPVHRIVLGRDILLSVRKRANNDTIELLDKTEELTKQYHRHIDVGNISADMSYEEYLEALANGDINMFALPMEKAILDDAEIVLQFDNNHNEFNFSKEYIRLFHNGRIISEQQYLFNRGRVCPKIRLLYPEANIDPNKAFAKYIPDDRIYVDVTPYKFRRVYYCKRVPETYFIDLTGYINKPFDIRYFDVYLNGRRLGTQNVVNISPASIALINVKSRNNLVIYERERDYEFYGQDYRRTDTKYIDFAKFIDVENDSFINRVGGPRKLIVYEIDRRKDEDCLVVPNTDEEEEYNFDDLISNLEFAEFYYNELIPKTSANPNQYQFSYDTLREDYPNIFRIYLNDAEMTLMLDPDILVGKYAEMTPDKKDPDSMERVFVVGHPGDVDETPIEFDWDMVNNMINELGVRKIEHHSI